MFDEPTPTPRVLTDRTRAWVRWWVIVALLAVLLYVLLSRVLLAQASPCVPEKPCTTISMGVEGPRRFTSSDLGGRSPLTQIDPHSYCEGRVIAGAIRYFTHGPVPTASVGVRVPGNPEVPVAEGDDPAHTYDEGDAIVLYDRTLVAGFVAVPTDGRRADVAWTCHL